MDVSVGEALMFLIGFLIVWGMFQAIDYGR